MVSIVADWMRGRASHRRCKRIRRLLPGCPRCSHPTLAPPGLSPGPHQLWSYPCRYGYICIPATIWPKLVFSRDLDHSASHPHPLAHAPTRLPAAHQLWSRAPTDPFTNFGHIRADTHISAYRQPVGQSWFLDEPSTSTNAGTTLSPALALTLAPHSYRPLTNFGHIPVDTHISAHRQPFGQSWFLFAGRGCGAGSGTAAVRQQTTEDRQQAANGKQQTAGRRRRVGGSTAAPRHDSTTTPPRKTPLGPAPESVTGPAVRKRDYYLAVKRGKA